MEKKEEPLSKALKEKIKARVADVASVGNLVPCVIIIHLIPDFSVQYISEIGLAFLDRTNDEIVNMTNQEYHEHFFNKEDANDYVPKILSLLERNTDESVSFFQQVRRSERDDWTWHLSVIKILLRDDDGNPLLSITTATPIDPQHHVTAKVSRLLDENNFLRNHYHQFGKLTHRERDILRFIALGKTAAQIGDKLHISPATVETHRRNIKQKLKTSNSFELSQYARAFDLI